MKKICANLSAAKVRKNIAKTKKEPSKMWNKLNIIPNMISFDWRSGHTKCLSVKKIYKRKYIHTTSATANSEFIKWNFCIYVLKCSKCHWIVLWCFLLGDRLLFIDSSWDWSKMPRKNFVLHQIVCIGDKNLFESKTFSLLLLAIDVLHIIISIGWRRKTKNRSHDV